MHHILIMLKFQRPYGMIKRRHIPGKKMEKMTHSSGEGADGKTGNAWTEFAKSPQVNS